MKSIFSVFILAVLVTFPVAAVTPDEARHLLHRTGFGVTASQWAEIIDLQYDDAIDLLVDRALKTGVLPPPSWTEDKPLITIVHRELSEQERRDLGKQKREMVNELRSWWLEQMLTTEAPLRERMTLFWSSHFPTEYVKVKAPMLLHDQNALLRKHALGRFDRLLHQVIRDPAMLFYLDNNKNSNNRINENLARELMELFTLGEGNYTEEDVKEAARCLTGWSVNRTTGEFIKRVRLHDHGKKTVLGKTGKHDGDDLVDILLDNPLTAQTIVRKLWLEFISPEPDEKLVVLWAKQFQKDKYRVDRLLRTMFKSDAFRNPLVHGTLIKSPVELYAGLTRPALDGLSREEKLVRITKSKVASRLPRLADLAGQKLFAPPNVKGWPGGTMWIDSKTLLMREHVSRNLVLGLSRDEKRGNPYARQLAKSDRGESANSVTTQMWMLSAIPPVTDIPVTYTERRTLLEIIRDPTIHLK